MSPCGILETVLYARDIDACADFYTRVLGLTIVAHEPGRDVFLRCGDSMLLIFNPDATRNQKIFINGDPVPPHGARGDGHMAFRATDEEIDTWQQQLLKHNVAIESRVKWPSGARSIYFRDPAGNCLEFATPNLWGIEET